MNQENVSLKQSQSQSVPLFIPQQKEDGKKKIFVQLLGGTGSQMLGLEKGYIIAKRTDRELILDLSSYTNGYHFPYALDYFNINFKKINYTFRSFSYGSFNMVPQDFVRDYMPEVLNTTPMNMEEIIQICEKIPSNRHIYLVGESPGCDETHYDEELRALFQPRTPTIFLDEFKKEIQNKQSVAIYLRRQEYVSLGFAKGFDFYQAAINYFTEKYGDVHFYIFSDNINEAKQALGNSDHYHYVKLVGGADSHIEALFCIAQCNHRIIGRTIWAYWGKMLHMGEGSEQVGYQAISSRHTSHGKTDVQFNDEDVQFYSKKEIKIIEPTRIYHLEEIFSTISQILGLGAQATPEQIHTALEIIVKLSFDTFFITKELQDHLFTLYESICLIKKDYLRAEQCLIEHLFTSPDSTETNLRLHHVKLIRQQPLKACFYGAKVCRLAEKSNIYQILSQTFKGGEYEEIFHQLTHGKKIHFIFKKQGQFSFQTNHFDALVSWVHKLGHQVSVMDTNISNSNQENHHLSRGYISYKSDSNIICYQLAEGTTTVPFSTNDIIQNIVATSDLPTVVVSRSPQFSSQFKNEIYWDYSSPLDQERFLYRGCDDAFFEQMDRKMCQNKPYVITTDPIKVSWFKRFVGDKVFLCEPYTEDSYHITGDRFEFEEQPISHDIFLKFVARFVQITDEITN